jgi:hypothetical protein
LIAGLDPRGIREARLLVNLKVCAENVRRSLDSMSNVSEIISSMFRVAHTENGVDTTNQCRKMLCSKLLEMEEKASWLD